MKDVIKLDQDEIITAIGVYLEARGASADVGTITFAFDGKGEVLVTLAGTLAGTLGGEEEEVLPEWVSRTHAEEGTVDCLSKKGLLKDQPCLWIEGHGITTVHPIEWPEELRQRHPLTNYELKEINQHLGHRKKVVSATLITDVEDRFGNLEMASALAQKDTKDFVSGEVLPAGSQVLWIEGHGVTATALEEWPPLLVLKFDEKKETNAATDILAGDGEGVLDRSSALERGLGKL